MHENLYYLEEKKNWYNKEEKSKPEKKEKMNRSSLSLNDGKIISSSFGLAPGSRKQSIEHK